MIEKADLMTEILLAISIVLRKCLIYKLRQILINYRSKHLSQENFSNLNSMTDFSVFLVWRSCLFIELFETKKMLIKIMKCSPIICDFFRLNLNGSSPSDDYHLHAATPT